jgi:hypothetical protein
VKSTIRTILSQRDTAFAGKRGWKTKATREYRKIYIFSALGVAGGYVGLAGLGSGRASMVMAIALAVCAMAVVVVVQAELKARRRAKQRGILCIGCGYDLRECSTCCPECGRMVPEGHRTHSDAVAALEKI